MHLIKFYFVSDLELNRFISITTDELCYPTSLLTILFLDSCVNIEMSVLQIMLNYSKY